MIQAALGGVLLLAALQAQPAKALMVTVDGSNYNIGFVEGYFTSNYLVAQSYSPGCGTDGATAYTTQDLYADGSGVLASQPWRGNSALALAFATAYRNAAQAVTLGSNDCTYIPNLNGSLECADSPYFAYAPSINAPYCDGYMFFNYGDSGTVWRRQAGYFAVVQSNPQPVPGPLPILGVAAAFGFSRRLRKRIRSVSS